MDVRCYIAGALRTDIEVKQFTVSYVQPWKCALYYPGRHDEPPCDEGDVVDVRRADSGLTIFAGWITDVAPGGISGEGVGITAQGHRFVLENEPVNINGRGFYIWNRRGNRCGVGAGEDSPGRDGGHWTAGEIIIDILEHALGLPAGGSDIPGHHGPGVNITDTYITVLHIPAYDAAEWMALDTEIGEYSVDNTPVAQAITELIAANGGFYGWYSDELGILHLVDMKALPAISVAAGELGHWQDEAGKGYSLLDNKLRWSLDGVYSRVLVQGDDKTVEVKPADIDGCGNAALNGGGEMELINSPWQNWAAAFRAKVHDYRKWAWLDVGWTSGSCKYGGCECGIPVGIMGIGYGARVYRGLDGGPKALCMRADSGEEWRISFSAETASILMFRWDVLGALTPGEKLWGWYWARVPFSVTAGPDGNAYYCYGHDRTLKIYDTTFKHPTSWPVAGKADDETAMQILADRMLQQVKDVRIQGQLICDGSDPDDCPLTRRYNVTNLSAP